MDLIDIVDVLFGNTNIGGVLFIFILRNSNGKFSLQLRQIQRLSWSAFVAVSVEKRLVEERGDSKSRVTLQRLSI